VKAIQITAARNCIPQVACTVHDAWVSRSDASAIKQGARAHNEIFLFEDRPFSFQACLSHLSPFGHPLPLEKKSYDATWAVKEVEFASFRDIRGLKKSEKRDLYAETRCGAISKQLPRKSLSFDFSATCAQLGGTDLMLESTLPPNV